MAMKATLGPNWLDYFDICVANANKPLFQRTEKAFYSLDMTKKNFKGKKIRTIREMKKCAENEKIFLEGNMRMLTNFF